MPRPHFPAVVASGGLVSVEDLSGIKDEGELTPGDCTGGWRIIVREQTAGNNGFRRVGTGISGA